MSFCLDFSDEFVIKSSNSISILCPLHLSSVWLHACISCLPQVYYESICLPSLIMSTLCKFSFIFRRWGIIAVLDLASFTACNLYTSYYYFLFVYYTGVILHILRLTSVRVSFNTFNYALQFEQALWVSMTILLIEHVSINIIYFCTITKHQL